MPVHAQSGTEAGIDWIKEHPNNKQKEAENNKKN